MSEHQQPPGLRLLSLDGGGIRGPSELLILQEILERIEHNLDLPETPRPCDYFDMIGGTSTGGLIALMLGRLGMSVGDAITCYGTLTEEVFTEVKWFSGNDKFKAHKLKEAIQKIVKDESGQTEELMMNPEFKGRQCKTFVCAMPAHAMRANVPYLFRTYNPPKYRTENCTIWEAARATSAAPTFFKPITIGTPGNAQPFVDGGLGRNNPTERVLKEAKLMFPGRPVACIVSIGTGEADTIEIRKQALFQRFLPFNVVRALQGIATDCEATAQDIARRFRGTSNVYFRFSVDRGLQHVGLADWERLPSVTAVTGQYLHMDDVDQKLDGAALAIQERPKAVAIPESVHEPEPPKTPIKFRPLYSTAFNDDLQSAAAVRGRYHGIVPSGPLKGYQSSVGNGALSLKFDGSVPVRWHSIFDAELPIGSVRVAAKVDLSRCKTIITPSGAGVLVILPDENDDGKACKYFFIVEPSEVPKLHVLKQKVKRAGGNPFAPLHYEALPHCEGRQKVEVEVTVLNGIVTISTNGVASTWVLRRSTSGGFKGLRAFGLCGIGPQRLTWTSFKVSVEDSELDTQTEDIPLASATKMEMWGDHE